MSPDDAAEQIQSLQEALYLAVARIEWLRDRVNKKNPHRKGTSEWDEWENEDAEQFIDINDEIEALKELLEAPPWASLKGSLTG